MTQEYVFTISTRDREHPLNQKMLIECGFHKDAPGMLIGGLQNVVDMLKILKTPEKVSAFMVENAQLSNKHNNLKQLIS